MENEHWQEATAERERQAERRSGIVHFLLRGAHYPFFSETTLMWLLSGVAFLLPLFFLPTQSISVEYAKMMLLSVVVVIGVVIVGVIAFRDRGLTVPRSMLLVVSLLILFVFLASAITSPVPWVSLVGIGGEIGTVSSMFILFTVLFLASLAFKRRDHVVIFFSALLSSAILLSLYHLLRHAFGPILSFGIFTAEISTPAGKWNDFATLVGGMMLLLLLGISFFPRNKVLRVAATGLFLIGLFLLLVIDFTILWLILFALTAILILLSVAQGEQAHRRRSMEDHEYAAQSHRHVRRVVGHIPLLALVLLVVSFFYGSGLAAKPLTESGRSVASFVGEYLKVPAYSEVVLTPSYTAEIIKNTLRDNLALGIGPNRFSSGYLTYKTTEMNRTPFWDATFDVGVGRIPTFFTTTGLTGLALWFAFIGLVFWKLRRIYPLLVSDRTGAFVGVSLFFLVIYFWSVAFFYLPSISVFLLAFLSTGALIGFLSGEGLMREFHARFGGSSASTFVVVPLIAMTLVGALASVVLMVQQAAAIKAFNEAQLAVAAGDIPAAQLAIEKAIARADRDMYRRFKSSLALAQLQQLATQQNIEPDTALREADGLITEARENAERAIALDPTNFENHLALGAVYDTAGALGIRNAAAAAQPSYERALELNPKSPRILFLLARLSYVGGDREKAKEYLYRAVSERPNFLEAISFLAQLELEDRNPEKALSVVRGGVIAEPTNFLLRFALGYLYYANRQFPEALIEFESAVFLNPVYADAKYFLGLTYAELGRRQDAITQFEGVLELNPDNADIRRILSNLRAGRAPFSGGISVPTQPVTDALESLGEGE